ncbi:MAG: 50S ribosomal protein L18 [Pseudomonadota bacterium]
MPLKKHMITARRRLRVRNKLKKMANDRPRLSVFRSSQNIYAQVIDDRQGKTLAAASTVEPSLGLRGKRNVDAASKVGALIAERAKQAGVEEVFFDRGAYLFHGRVKALADAAREGGLKF